MHRFPNKYRLSVEGHLLALCTLMCFGLSIARWGLTGSPDFLSLNWNLFLAFIPWGLSRLTQTYPKIQHHKIRLAFLLIAWLLFFPNAPYILTDLFHFRHATGAPIWFDLVLFLSFAWTGLLFGFLSLRDMERFLRKFIPYRWVIGLTTGLLFLGSYGIYLGRYLRWNSWDIVRSPFGLLLEIGTQLTHPFQYPRAWAMTLLMGVLLNMIYWSFRLVSQRESRHPLT